MLQNSRVVILIKALPQPSKSHGETVCCAGVTADGHWKRLFPVRFRRLKEDTSFARWNWIKFSFEKPPKDSRPESCRLFEDTIQIDGKLSEIDRPKLLEPMIMGSAVEAASSGKSLALIRPKNTCFYFKKKSVSQVADEQQKYAAVARQVSFLDEELAAYQPNPFEFRFKFSDSAGQHDYACGDWEVNTTFWKWRKLYGEHSTLQRMDQLFNQKYPSQGMVFGIGNMASRPQTWQLLAVIRLNETMQLGLNL
jgi:hypothetical protein